MKEKAPATKSLERKFSIHTEDSNKPMTILAIIYPNTVECMLIFGKPKLQFDLFLIGEDKELLGGAVIDPMEIESAIEDFLTKTLRFKVVRMEEIK